MIGSRDEVKTIAYLCGQANFPLPPEEGELFQLVQINVHKLAVMFIERLSECKQTRKLKLICVCVSEFP